VIRLKLLFVHTLFLHYPGACIYHPGNPVFHDAMKVSIQHFVIVFIETLPSNTVNRVGRAVKREVRTLQTS